MARLTDEELPVKGTAVVVKSVEDLVVYQGKLDPRLSAPCDNWFEDEDPPRKVPEGLIAIRQRSTGCLAFLVENKSKQRDHDTGFIVADILASVFTGIP